MTGEWTNGGHMTNKYCRERCASKVMFSFACFLSFVAFSILLSMHFSFNTDGWGSGQRVARRRSGRCIRRVKKCGCVERVMID